MRNTYIIDDNGIELYEGDEVLYEVKRVSPNYSSWGQVRSKNDGKYWIKGKIVWKESQFVILADNEEYIELKKPKGKEQGDREVWFSPMELSDCKRYDIGVKKIINETVDIEKIDRFKMLGIGRD